MLPVLELKSSVALILPEVGVTIAIHFTMSLANDHGEVGFFLGVSPIILAETSRRLLSIIFVINATYVVYGGEGK